MRLSIIIPVYNLANYIAKCIESILSQDFNDFEILIIDDGSTDESYNICNSYAKNDDRITIIRQENMGVSVARNRGISNAKGEWMCFIDGDDWIEPNSLSRIVNANYNTLVDIIIGRSFKNENGITTYEYFPFSESWQERVFKGTNLFIEESYGRGSACGVIYSRRFLLTNNIHFPLNLKIGEDSVFFTLCLIYAENVGFADIHFYNVHARPGSALRSWTFPKILSMVDTISFLNSYIDSHPKLNKHAISVLNYAKYGVISNIYNYFHFTLSINNYLVLRQSIKSRLKGRIEIGDIRLNKNKVRILNFSLDLFAIMVLVKNKISNKDNKSQSKLE